MSIVQRRSRPGKTLCRQAIEAFEKGDLELFDELILQINDPLPLTMAHHRGPEFYWRLYDRLVYKSYPRFRMPEGRLKPYREAILREIPPEIPREVARHILGFLPLGRITI